MAVVTRITIVTFNDNEGEAVRQTFDDLRGGGWKNAVQSDPTDIRRRALDGSGDLQLSHIRGAAQGNVAVAAQLVSIFAGSGVVDRPDYVVFYGCAGTPEAKDIGNVYLVAQVRYLGLGTVKIRKGNPTELVTLKNKWIEAAVHPREVTPIAAGAFPLIGGTADPDLLKATDFPPARVLATEAVVHVLPAATPPSANAVGIANHWASGDWSYSDAMAHVIHQSAGMDNLIEMESHGIASATKALGLGERVVVMRVATDALEGKATTKIGGGQGPLLMNGRVALMQLLGVLLGLNS